jgi:hypothetical protein
MPASSLDLVYVKFPVQLIHPADVHKDQDDKYIDRPLLSKPEAQLKAAQADLIEGLYQKNTENIRNYKPDR